jgi:hypothetical protein
MNYHRAIPLPCGRRILTTVDYARQFNTEYCVLGPSVVMPPYEGWERHGCYEPARLGGKRKLHL